MNGLRLSAYFAIIYGLGLGCFETFINWGQWQWWPFWLIDYVAAIFLIFSGITTFKRPNLGSKLLSMAWGLF